MDRLMGKGGWAPTPPNAGRNGKMTPFRDERGSCQENKAKDQASGAPFLVFMLSVLNFYSIIFILIFLFLLCFLHFVLLGLQKRQIKLY